IIAQDWANHVTAVNAKTGEIDWQTSIGPNASDSERQIPRLIATADAVFAISSKQTLNALDLKTGEVKWSVAGITASQTAVSGDVIAVIQSIPPDYENVLIAYDSTNGSALWQRTLDNPDSTHPGTKLLGGSNWFAFTSSNLGELEPIAETPPATPMSGVVPRMTGSSTSLFPTRVPFSVVFTVRAESGFLQSVSRWTENPNPQSEPEISSLDSAAITIGISENTERGILVLCQDGRVGWFGGYGATGESFYGISTKTFNGGAISFPHDLPGISFNVVLVDDTAAYIAMRDGSLIAIEGRPLPTGNG
ncbi:MAG: PQQ-binding-like beta-propeller repeat protein, partial [Thermomicrobiales bacterium]